LGVFEKPYRLFWLHANNDPQLIWGQIVTANNSQVNFDFLFVVPGVAIGLAIVRVCQFLGNLLVYGHVSDWSRLPALWMVLWSIALLSFTAQYWFFSAKRRQRRDYAKNFGAYLCVMAMPLLISFMSFVLCPNWDEPSFKQLGLEFKANSPLLYLLIGLAMWAATAESFVVGEQKVELSYPSENTARTIVGAIFVAAWLVMKLVPQPQIEIDKDLVMALLSAALVAFRLAMCKWPI
jgi:hypothetical protein